MKVYVYCSPISYVLASIGFIALFTGVVTGRAFETDFGRLKAKGYCSTEQICQELGYLTEHGAATTKGWNATH